MPRKAYKPLYLSAVARLDALRHEHANTVARLKEIENALIPHGKAALTNIPDGSEAIVFSPLEFVASRAFMEAHQRITYDNGGYSMNYTWRGRPIYRAKE